MIIGRDNFKTVPHQGCRSVACCEGVVAGIFDRKHVVFIIAVYIACYGVFTLVSVPFWDDWVLLGHTSAGLWEMFSQLGRREQYFIIAPFAAMESPLTWAAMSFICWGSVPICTYGVLRGIGWTPANAFWASLLTAASPLNQARFALAVLPYSFSAMFFSVSLLLFVVSVSRRSLWLRGCATALLLMSFTTNSFLTMSPLVVVVIFLALRRRDPGKKLRQTALDMTSYAELLILPFFYWFAKSVLQPVYGIYANYNQFQMGPIQGLLRAAERLVSQPKGWEAIFPTSDSFVEAGFMAFILIGLMVLVGKLVRLDAQTSATPALDAWGHVVILTGMAVLAFFPYAIVGLRPSYTGLWESRHQTTLALVAGTLSFSIANAVLKSRFVPAFCLFLLLVFAAMDISVSRQLMADVSDSSAIIRAKQIASIPADTTAVVQLENEGYRMMARTFRFYELSAMLSANAPRHAIMGVAAGEFPSAHINGADFSAPGGISAKLAGICARWVNFPEYGFGDIGERNQFVEVSLISKMPPPTYWEGLVTTIGLAFMQQDAFDRASARLEVKTKIYPDVIINCRDPAPN